MKALPPRSNWTTISQTKSMNRSEPSAQDTAAATDPEDTAAADLTEAIEAAIAAAAEEIEEIVETVEEDIRK